MLRIVIDRCFWKELTGDLEVLRVQVAEGRDSHLICQRTKYGRIDGLHDSPAAEDTDLLNFCHKWSGFHLKQE